MQKTHNPSRPPAALPALIRVLLVSNHQLAVWGLEKFLETTASEIAVVGKAGNATDALRLAQQTRPDVVLLCLDMGSPSLNLIPKLLKQKQLRVVAMTGSSNAQASDRAVLSGAHGLLRREDSVDAIIKSIRKVHDGELWLDRAATGRVFGMLTRSDERSDPDAAKIADLTARAHGQRPASQNCRSTEDERAHVAQSSFQDLRQARVERTFRTLSVRPASRSRQVGLRVNPASAVDGLWQRRANRTNVPSLALKKGMNVTRGDGESADDTHCPQVYGLPSIRTCACDRNEPLRRPKALPNAKPGLASNSQAGATGAGLAFSEAGICG